MADLFEADHGNLWQAEKSIQLAHGGDHASLKRERVWKPEEI